MKCRPVIIENNQITNVSIVNVASTITPLLILSLPTTFYILYQVLVQSSTPTMLKEDQQLLEPYPRKQYERLRHTYVIPLTLNDESLITVDCLEVRDKYIFLKYKKDHHDEIVIVFLL